MEKGKKYWGPSPGPLHHTTKGLFTADSLSCQAIKKKIKNHIKRQKTQYEETEQASEPEVAEMLELSNWEYKISETEIWKVLTNQVRNTQD